MEACSGAHHLGRLLASQGHDVRLMPAQYVRPYIKSHKNDDRDAEAIAEAVQRPTMRFVPLKDEEQLDLQSLPRVRERLVARRTGLINQIRSFLLDRGLTVRPGRASLQQQMPRILDGDVSHSLSGRMRRLLHGLWDEWRWLDGQIVEVTQDIDRRARQDAACQRLTSIPGIGPILATALIGAIGDGAAFSRGRDLAAWLGLVPRQHSTGGKPRLLGISKRGNRYLRKLFIHGARAVLHYHDRQRNRLGAWLLSLVARVHPNIAAVALANKLARIAWSVLARKERYAAAATAA